MYSNKAKYVHRSVDIGNDRYTNLQNCILLKYKSDQKQFCAQSQNHQNVPTTLWNTSFQHYRQDKNSRPENISIEDHKGDR